MWSGRRRKLLNLIENVIQKKCYDHLNKVANIMKHKRDFYLPATERNLN